MGLIYRTSSLANVGASSIKNAALTYEEGDGNIAFLLTNLSGSNTIQGTTTISGPVQINNTVQMDGTLFVTNLTSTAQNSIITYDSATGRFYYTASSAIIPPTPPTPAAPSDTFIQFNSASQFGATSSFKFDYTRQVLNHGDEVNNLISGGFYSHAQGKDTYSTGDYSHAEGLGTYANSPYSHTEGRFTWVYGTASHAEGNNTKVGTRFAWSGSARFSYVTMSSEYSNIASSFNIGDRLYLYRSIGGFALVDVTKIVTESVYDPISDTTILGLDSSVGSTRLSLFVGNTQISPSFWGGGGSYIVPLNYSHTEGNNADALNEASHAEGDSTVAYGYASHAEGLGTKTIGQYSHAEGEGTIAIGRASHTAGWSTVASGSYQSVIGQFNLSSSAQSAFIIGNGADNNNRRNLLFAQGTVVQITGSLTVTGSAYVIGLTSASQTSVLTYDTASGQLYFTASSAIGISIPTGSFLTTGSLSTTQQLSGSLNVTGSLNFFSGSTNATKIENGWVVLSQVSASLDFANDTAAAAGGVPLGGLYRNGNAISIRIS